MDEKLKHKFMEMLKEEISTPVGMSVVMSMVGMVENDERFEQLAELYEGIEEYKNYATEKEAKKVVQEFINYDGSRGPKWQPQVLFSAVESLGGKRAEQGKYNCWALYAYMNMMHSDYGGVLKNYAQGEEYAKLCYMLAVADLTDRDLKHTIRQYFKLAH